MLSSAEVRVASGSRDVMSAGVQVATSVGSDESIRSLASLSSKRKGKGRAEVRFMDPALASDSEGRLRRDEREDGNERGQGSELESEDDEDSYEAERQRRILENQMILANLGIHTVQPGGSTSMAGPSTLTRRPDGQPSAVRRKKNVSDVPIYDRSGHIVSLPAEGTTHTIACVEMSSDRKLKKRIIDGEYTDCSWWKDGEARRWRFGRGQGGDLADGEEERVGGVGKDFRWRRWRGLEKELRREMRLRGELIERDHMTVERPEKVEGASAYFLIPGQSCHQCRRKSEKAKMKCRNVNPICSALFCETCCKRYSYFDFDEESRSFICPLCKDCCNCSNCIRKRNLAHLLDGQHGLRRKSIKHRMEGDGNEALTVQAWLEKAVKDEWGAPFDCVRLVDEALDVISPALPIEDKDQEVAISSSKPPRPKKRKKLADLPDGKDTKEEETKKVKRAKTAGITSGIILHRRRQPSHDPGEFTPGKPEPAGEAGKPDLRIKLRIPAPVQTSVSQPAERVKEIDSDGDTVGDWASDGGRSSDLTPLSSDAEDLPPVAPRLPFPFRPTVPQPPSTNEYLSHLTGPQLSQIAGESTVLDDDQNHSSLEPGHAPIVDGIPRRKPPPQANIIRAPRHSFSKPTGDKGCIPADGPVTFMAPSMAVTLSDGLPETPSGAVEPPSKEPAAFPIHDVSTTQTQTYNIFPPQRLSDRQQYSYWNARTSMTVYETLLPNESSTMVMPDLFDRPPLGQTLYPSHSDYLSDPLDRGPPPYSHSPTRRPLELSPDAEAHIESQYVSFDRPSEDTGGERSSSLWEQDFHQTVRDHPT
ncbi:hypothetical protein IAU60_000443 [Kwoniella sp. DSM 27419]